MSRNWSSSTIVDTPIVLLAETAALTSQGVSQSVDGEPVTIRGSVGILTGASTTAVTLRVREGNGIAGNVIGETIPFSVGAAADTQVPYGFTYNPAAIAGMPYTVTVQQTAATGNGTIKSVSMTVSVGQP